MNKREILKQLRGNVTPEQRRGTAYHEAGHAAMQFMFGNCYNIDHINMGGTLDFAACVWARERDFSRLLVTGFSGESRPFLIPQAKQKMMHDLAGHAVEGRLGCVDSCCHWLETKLDSEDWEWEGSNHDLYKAVQTAKAIHGDNGNAWRLLRRVASWTDEAIAHPRLWGVVGALAEELLTVKTRMAGSRACRIMEKAWGEGTMLAYMDMGRHWRRRFAVAVE